MKSEIYSKKESSNNCKENGNKFDRETIREKAEKVTVKDGMIILDRNNPEHRYWYEEE